MDIFEGRITSCGFDSGDRIVIGMWESSPFGSFADIMWAKPDGTKILIAPNSEIGDYIFSLYDFDEVKIEEIKIKRKSKEISFSTTDINCQFNWGKEISFLIKRRPLWFVATVEYFFGWLISSHQPILCFISLTFKEVLGLFILSFLKNSSSIAKVPEGVL